MIEDPILVMCMGRSGSSMTAGVLAAHGVWTGTTMRGDRANPRGYFENVEIKKRLIRWAGKDITRVYPPVPGWRARAERVVRSDGYVEGPWLVKHSVIFHRLWDEFESPRYVLPRRDSEAIFQSVRRTRFHSWQSDDQLRETIELHQQTLDELRDTRDAVEVDTDAVVRGDLSTLRGAVEFCGLGFDENAAREFIDPSLWHSPLDEIVSEKT